MTQDVHKAILLTPDQARFIESVRRAKERRAKSVETSDDANAVFDSGGVFASLSRRVSVAKSIESQRVHDRDSDYPEADDRNNILNGCFTSLFRF